MNGNTALISLVVIEIDELFNNAANVGAVIISPPRDYDYGYRQARISDPFGHQWMLQMKIDHTHSK